MDLSRMAGLKPAGVICEIMKEDGTMARVPDLEKFSAEHGVKMVTVAQIIEYRRTYETLVKCAVETKLPTPFGEFRLSAYENEIDDLTHLAIIMGEPEGKDEVLVRVHSACLTGDALHSLRCDCGSQLEAAMETRGRRGRGGHRLHAAGGPGHRAPQQDEGLPPPGRGARHRRGEPEARPRPRPAGLRDRGPDPQGARAAAGSAS